MAKQSVRFVCSNCGAVTSAWAGRCSQCGEWNTLQEEAVIVHAGNKSGSGSGIVLKPQAVNESTASDGKRLTTGITDIDAVLGGGIVTGSVNLIAGQPGIG